MEPFSPLIHPPIYPTTSYFPPIHIYIPVSSINLLSIYIYLIYIYILICYPYISLPLIHPPTHSSIFMLSIYPSTICVYVPSIHLLIYPSIYLSINISTTHLYIHKITYPSISQYSYICHHSSVHIHGSYTHHAYMHLSI